jgi:hypothetical protein
MTAPERPHDLPPQQEAACQWAHGDVTDLDHRGLCPICAADEDEDDR